MDDFINCTEEFNLERLEEKYSPLCRHHLFENEEEVFKMDKYQKAIDAIKYLVQKKLLKATSTQKLNTESFNYPIRGNVKLYLASNVEKAVSNFKGRQFQSTKELEIKFARLLEAIKLLREREINAAS